MSSSWRRSPEDNRKAQREQRQKKIADGYVKLQVWVKIEHRNEIRRFIKFLHNE